MKPAEYLNAPRQNHLKLLVVVLSGMLTLPPMHNAQADALRTAVLKDPTQPPASLSADVSSEQAQSTSTAGPVLQSVMLGAQYHAAIINGQKILLGKKYEQATLIKLSEDEAVLRNPDMSTQTLVMDYAGIKKTALPAVQLTRANVKKTAKTE